MSGALSIREYRPGMLRAVQLKRHIQKPLDETAAQLQNETVVSPDNGCPSSVETDNCGEVPVRVKPRTSFSRARTAVFEYALCNDWEWFVTFTPGCELHYNDLDEFMKSVAHWVRNMRRVPGYESFKYIIVPEKFDTSDGWHLHGFVCGVPECAIVPFDPASAKNAGQRIKMENLNKDGYKDFPAYSSRFGFSTCRRITDISRDAAYICSYMMKSFSDFVEAAGCCLYYSCRGLKRSQRVFYGEVEFSDAPSSLVSMIGDLPPTWTDKYRNAYYSAFSFSNKYVTVGDLGFFSVNMDLCNELFIDIYTPDGNEQFRLFDILEIVELAGRYNHISTVSDPVVPLPCFEQVSLCGFA